MCYDIKYKSYFILWFDTSSQNRWCQLRLSISLLCPTNGWPNGNYPLLFICDVMEKLKNDEIKFDQFMDGYFNTSRNHMILIRWMDRIRIVYSSFLVFLSCHIYKRQIHVWIKYTNIGQLLFKNILNNYFSKKWIIYCKKSHWHYFSYSLDPQQRNKATWP